MDMLLSFIQSLSVVNSKREHDACISGECGEGFSVWSVTITSVKPATHAVREIAL